MMTNEEFQQIVLQQFSDIKAELGSVKTEVGSLKTEGDNTHLATKDDIATLSAKIEVINSRLFHQEAEIVRLKAIK